MPGRPDGYVLAVPAVAARAADGCDDAKRHAARQDRHFVQRVAVGQHRGEDGVAAGGRVEGRQDAVRVERHLNKAGLPTHIADIPGFDADPDAIVEAMLQDKKVSRGQLTFILARGIGQSFIAKGVEASDVREFLNEELAREAA